MFWTIEFLTYWTKCQKLSNSWDNNLSNVLDSVQNITVWSFRKVRLSNKQIVQLKLQENYSQNLLWTKSPMNNAYCQNSPIQLREITDFRPVSGKCA